MDIEITITIMDLDRNLIIDPLIMDLMLGNGKSRIFR